MLVLGIGLLAGAGTASAATASDLIFSEYIEGSSFNKALEIYNGTGGPVGLAGYSVELYSNGVSAPSQTVALSGSIAAGDVFVLAHGSADPAILAAADLISNAVVNFNGDDAVVLRKAGAVVDVIGQVGFDPGSQWGAGDASTADNTIRRKDSVVAGDTNAADAFDPAVEWNGFPNNTLDGIGFHGAVADEPVLAACGSGISVFAGNAGSGSVSATDADDTVIDIQISAVSPTPSAGTITLSGLVPAAADGGTATATISSSADLAPGSYTVTVTATNDDATPQTGSCAFAVAIKAIRPIGEIQGSVTDTTNGFTFDSPLVGQNVVVRGVIFQRHRSGNNRGFFIQNTETTDDNDSTTSDGLFVFVGGFDTLLGSVPGYVPQIGDEVILSGRVTEFFDLTQLSSPRLEEVVQSFVDLDATIPAFEAAPPSDLADAYRYWERREGMRGVIPAGALTIDGTDRFGLDAEQWVMRPDAPVASAADPFARRSFRDAHPLDDLPGLFDNGNGYRIMIGAGGLKGNAFDPTVVLTPLRTYETVTNDVLGGVYFSFGKYAIMASEQLEATPGVDPATNNPPAPAADGEYSVSNYNVENLYDFRDDPNDGCDFAGNSGCPGVSPPFDYVPASEETYQKHLTDIAIQVTEDLHSPDLILVQEAEDQDICEVAAGALVCGTDDDADGKPDTLQELALAISAAGGAPYDAAYDRDGRDDRGIVSGFLYRTDRVELLPASASHPVLGESPAVEYRAPGLAYNEDVENPKALNADLPSDVDTSTGRDGNDVFTRAPQVGLFRFWRNGIGNGTWIDVYAISNHFSSTPNARVGQRTEQANYDAAIVAALGEGARVLVGGDFNVFPRPDDPFVPGDALFPSDQLGAFYDAGLVAMWERIAAEAPVTAYSYVFQGQTQTLDTQFLTPSLADEVVDSRIAHVNSDWPADYAGDRARGASDHDPIATRIEVPVTIESLGALLQWCADEGQITGNNTLKQLQHHLDMNQIGPFVNQTLGKTPQFVTESCSAALVSSAQAIG